MSASGRRAGIGEVRPTASADQPATCGSCPRGHVVARPGARFCPTCGSGLVEADVADSDELVQWFVDRFEEVCARSGRPLSRDDIDVLWTDCVLAAKVRPTEALEVTERLRALGRALGPEDAALWSCRYRSFDEMDESTVVMWVLDDLFGGGP
jgi:hypothetical protein